MKVISEISFYDLNISDIADEIVANDLEHRFVSTLALSMVYPDKVDEDELKAIVDTFLDGIRRLGVEDYE